MGNKRKSSLFRYFFFVLIVLYRKRDIIPSSYFTCCVYVTLSIDANLKQKKNCIKESPMPSGHLYYFFNVLFLMMVRIHHVSLLAIDYNWVDFSELKRANKQISRLLIFFIRGINRTPSNRIFNGIHVKNKYQSISYCHL